MKIVGGIIILIASITVSYFYENTKKAEIKALKQIKDFVLYIKIQIELFSLPLSEIFTKYKHTSDVIKELIETKQVSVFNKQIRDELFGCFSVLGTGFKDEQLSRLTYLIVFLDKAITESEKDYPQKIKVNRALSLFVGCSTVILLI